MIKLHKRREGGYVGLAALLIVLALASVFLVTVLHSSIGPVRWGNGIATSTGQTAIQEAENAKRLLEKPR